MIFYCMVIQNKTVLIINVIKIVLLTFNSLVWIIKTLSASLHVMQFYVEGRLRP